MNIDLIDDEFLSFLADFFERSKAKTVLYVHQSKLKEYIDLYLEQTKLDKEKCKEQLTAIHDCQGLIYIPRAVQRGAVNPQEELFKAMILARISMLERACMKVKGANYSARDIEGVRLACAEYLCSFKKDDSTKPLDYLKQLIEWVCFQTAEYIKLNSELDDVDIQLVMDNLAQHSALRMSVLTTRVHRYADDKTSGQMFSCYEFIGSSPDESPCSHNRDSAQIANLHHTRQIFTIRDDKGDAVTVRTMQSFRHASLASIDCFELRKCPLSADNKHRTSQMMQAMQGMDETQPWAYILLTTNYHIKSDEMQRQTGAYNLMNDYCWQRLKAGQTNPIIFNCSLNDFAQFDKWNQDALAGNRAAFLDILKLVRKQVSMDKLTDCLSELWAERARLIEQYQQAEEIKAAEFKEKINDCYLRIIARESVVYQHNKSKIDPFLRKTIGQCAVDVIDTFLGKRLWYKGFAGTDRDERVKFGQQLMELLQRLGVTVSVGCKSGNDRTWRIYNDSIIPLERIKFAFREQLDEPSLAFLGKCNLEITEELPCSTLTTVCDTAAGPKAGPGWMRRTGSLASHKFNPFISKTSKPRHISRI